MDSRSKDRFETVSVIPAMPSAFGQSNDPIPADLIGATILRIGAPETALNVEGGGLVIDYVPTGSSHPVRIILGFTELGMWVEYHSG